MANLTADREDLRQDGILQLFPVAAVKIYKGALVALNASGYAKPAAAGDKRVVGIAFEQADNAGGAAGAKTIRVWRQGTFELNSSGLTQANVGDLVYVTDDNTVTLTAAGSIVVGVITEFVSATKARVDINQRA